MLTNKYEAQGARRKRLLTRFRAAKIEQNTARLRVSAEQSARLRKALDEEWRAGVDLRKAQLRQYTKPAASIAKPAIVATRATARIVERGMLATGKLAVIGAQALLRSQQGKPSSPFAPIGKPSTMRPTRRQESDDMSWLFGKPR